MYVSWTGQPGLQLTVVSAWIWSEVGFYTLHLNITLPNVTYVQEGLQYLEIVVHTSAASALPGDLKIVQILPRDIIPIDVSSYLYWLNV